MWLKNFTYAQLLVALLLVQYNVMLTSAAVNIAQLKSKQQQTLTQESTAASSTQHQQQQQQSPQQQSHSLHVRTQTQHHRNIPAIATHPSNNDNSDNAIHDATQAMSPSSGSSLSYAPPATQYVVNDKETATMQEVLKHFQADDDSYQLLNEFKREAQVNTNHGQTVAAPPPPPILSSPPTANSVPYPWNFYNRPYVSAPAMAGVLANMFNPFETFTSHYPVTPRFLPIMTYPQPVYVPYPLLMPPDIFYPSFSPMTPHMTDDYEDSMSRGAATLRRPASNQQSTSFSRNSPIYYVRLPPTPYMFLPSLGLGTPNTGIPGYPTMFPYQSLPPFPSYSSIFNVPINFLANGKPSNIYQMSSAPPSNEMQNHLQFANIPSSFNTRPPPPPPNHYRPPAIATNSYFSPQSPSTSSSNYGASSSSSSAPALNLPAPPSSSQDSKLTALKRPYYFNGRPEEIYVLPNNFNPLYSSAENSYY